jgi:hypothetical protein
LGDLLGPAKTIAVGGVDGGVNTTRLEYRMGGCVAFELPAKGCMCSGVDNTTVGRTTGDDSSDESRNSALDDDGDAGGEGNTLSMREEEYFIKNVTSSK